MEITEKTVVYAEHEGFTFDFYPYFGLALSSTLENFEYTLYYFGRAGFNIDWKRTCREKMHVYIETNSAWTYSQWCLVMSRCCRQLDKEMKNLKGKKLLENIDEETGKPLSIFSIRAHISRMKTFVKQDKLSAQGIADWFNKFNIEDDMDRQRCGTGKMVVLKTKSRMTMINEGARALEDLFRLGKLRKQKRK